LDLHLAFFDRALFHALQIHQKQGRSSVYLCVMERNTTKKSKISQSEQGRKMCGTPSVPQEQLVLIKGKEMGQEPGKVHERNAPDSSKATATLPCDVADAGSEKNQHSHRDDDHCHSIASRM